MEAFVELGIYACLCIVSALVSTVLPAGYIMYERKKKGDKSKERANLGAELGLEMVDAQGGQDRLGGQRGAFRWQVGWEVRKIAGGSPGFVTFFECYPQGLPQVEVRFKLPGKPSPMSGMFGAPAPLGQPAFDEHFEVAGAMEAITPSVQQGMLNLKSLGDDLYVMPDRIVLLYKGDHKDSASLRQRIEAIEHFAQLF